MSSSTPNFDPVARIYRWAEYLTLGPLLHRTRTHFLPHLTSCRRALVLGDGDGRFLAKLLTANPALLATAIDTSAAMLQLLTQRCAAYATRLSAQQTSALTITPATDTDLIVTHFFLDCLTQPEVDDLATRLAAAVRPGTLWLLSDFGPPRPVLLKPLANLYVRALYLAFRILTGLRVARLPDPQSALTSAGFTPIARHDRVFGLIYTELWLRR
jgi:SAM-dependent methyltransferase